MVVIIHHPFCLKIQKTTHAVLALTMMAYTIVTERTVVMEVQFAL